MEEEESGLAQSGLESREESGQVARFWYEQWMYGGAITDTFGEKIKNLLLDT